MSAVAGNVKSLSSASRFMEVSIKGRIDASRRYESRYYTRVITPAEDSYSRPQVVEIRSEAKLGQRGDEISVSCRLGGFTRKPYAVFDKVTGERTMVTPCDLTLDLAE